MSPFAIIATAGLALLAAACGGSTSSHVAQLGSATTTVTTRTRSSPSSTSSAQSAHLLPSGGGGGGAGTRGDQLKLAFGLKTARCMRSHGYPTYPDPPNASTSSQGSGTRFEGTGIDTKSPRFQTRETACEKQVRKALGLP